MNRADQYYLPSEMHYRRQRAAVKRRNRRWPWSTASGAASRGSRELH
jgi:hypothetical protein